MSAPNHDGIVQAVAHDATPCFSVSIQNERENLFFG